MKHTPRLAAAALGIGLSLFVAAPGASARNVRYDCGAGTGTFGGLGTKINGFVVQLTAASGATYTYTFTRSQDGSTWTASASTPPGGPVFGGITPNNNASQIDFTLTPAGAFKIDDVTGDVEGNFAKKGDNCPQGYPLNLPGAKTAGVQTFDRPLAPVADALGSATDLVGRESRTESGRNTLALGAAGAVAVAGAVVAVRRRRADAI